MVRFMVIIGFTVAAGLFVLYQEDGQEESGIITTSEVIVMPPVVEPVPPLVDLDAALVVEDGSNIIEPVVETPSTDSVTLDVIIEPEFLKPPVISLEDSDDFIRAALVTLFPGFSEGELLEKGGVLQRLVILVNDISQGDVLFKHRLFLKPSVPLSVLAIDDYLIINPESYHRFDSFVAAFSQVDVDAAVVFLDENKRLMQIVFNAFSHADDFTLDNMFLSAIDEILAAPVISEEIAVTKKSSRYQFVNSDYEALSHVAKQMIRFGPENTRSVQEKLNEFRTKIVL